jgi:serine/threonine-protein kinase RsbW
VSDLKLVLPARSENVAVVRQALTGLGEAMTMDPAVLADLKTVVTEACMNVVVHAYGEGATGPLEVTVSPDQDVVAVVVRDYGSGIQPRPIELDAPSLRLGLPLIAALSSSFEIRGGPGRGTEVRLTMSLNGEEGLIGAAAGDEDVQAMAMEIPPGPMVRPVIARVIAMLAARSELSIDRLSDAVLLGDAVSAHPPSDFTGPHVGLQIEDGDGAMELRIGPLDSGAGDRIIEEMELPGVGASLEKLADEIRVDSQDSGEYLTLVIAQRS